MLANCIQSRLYSSASCVERSSSKDPRLLDLSCNIHGDVESSDPLFVHRLPGIFLIALWVKLDSIHFELQLQVLLALLLVRLESALRRLVAGAAFFLGLRFSVCSRSSLVPEGTGGLPQRVAGASHHLVASPEAVLRVCSSLFGLVLAGFDCVRMARGTAQSWFSTTTSRGSPETGAGRSSHRLVHDTTSCSLAIATWRLEIVD